MLTKSYIETGDEAGLQPPQLEADRGDQLLHRRAEVPRAGGEPASPQLREGLAHGHLQGGGQHVSRDLDTATYLLTRVLAHGAAHRHHVEARRRMGVHQTVHDIRVVDIVHLEHAGVLVPGTQLHLHTLLLQLGIRQIFAVDPR